MRILFMGLLLQGGAFLGIKEFQYLGPIGTIKNKTNGQ